MAELTHINKEGKPGMVDVSSKAETRRKAKAQAVVRFNSETYQALADSGFENKKGSIFQTAIIAGTMAVKRTADLIPFCHTLPIESCKIEILEQPENSLTVLCEVIVSSKTGVEMEALTGANIAALSIYDMTKALSHDIEIHEVKLLQKSGGKSDYKIDSQ